METPQRGLCTPALPKPAGRWTGAHHVTYTHVTHITGHACNTHHITCTLIPFGFPSNTLYRHVPVQRQTCFSSAHTRKHEGLVPSPSPRVTDFSSCFPPTHCAGDKNRRETGSSTRLWRCARGCAAPWPRWGRPGGTTVLSHAPRRCVATSGSTATPRREVTHCHQPPCSRCRLVPGPVLSSPGCNIC